MGRKRSVHPTKPSVYYNIIKHGPTFHMTGEREREREGEAVPTSMLGGPLPPLTSSARKESLKKTSRRTAFATDPDMMGPTF